MSAPYAVVVVFPGSNCDLETERALSRAGFRTDRTWHTELRRGAGLYVLPGGFSYGDYLRAGAIAARSSALSVLRQATESDGAFLLGICNGFQILTETGLLPGSLEANEPIGFRCRPVSLTPRGARGPFGRALGSMPLTFPIAHITGRYVVDEGTRVRLWDEGRVLATYADVEDPNGSTDRIAGITDLSGRIAGLMPHPERAADPRIGSQDGLRFFETLAAQVDAGPSDLPPLPAQPATLGMHMHTDTDTDTGSNVEATPHGR